MNEYVTRQTLLEKIKNQYDESSWIDFVHFYERFIYSTVRQSGLSIEESKDVTQNVLLKLWNTLPTFSYDKKKGGFRNWLYRVTKCAIIDYWRKEERHKKQVDSYAQKVGYTEGGEPLLDRIMESEWKAHISNLAMEKVSSRFSGKAIGVFYALLEGKSVTAVAEEFDIAENTVYVYRSRVSEKLSAEIKYLKKQLG